MIFKKFSRKRFLYVDCGYFFAALGACEQILGIRCMGYFIAVRFGFDKVAVFVHQPSLGYMRGCDECSVAAFRARTDFDSHRSSLPLPENLVATERSDFFYESEWEHSVFTLDVYPVVFQELIISFKRIRILETSLRKNRFIEISPRIAEELGIKTTDKLLSIDIQGYFYLTGLGN